MCCKGYAMCCKGYAMCCKGYAMYCKGYAMYCKGYAMCCKGYTMCAGNSAESGTFHSSALLKEIRDGAQRSHARVSLHYQTVNGS